jgi:tRNA modification GTPase
LRELFQPTAGRLPEAPVEHGLWFGRFGERAADEVIVVAQSASDYELHCHGGRQVVAWVLEVLRSRGVLEEPWADRPNDRFADPAAAAILPFARTVRTAGILLDQAQGAYARALAAVATGDPESAAIVATLRRNARVGRHLVKPWRVAIAGAPNAGKSSLLNALAGFDRSVVSPIPGTTRDAVHASLAFDGWPVEVFDTAGLRAAADVLEAEGVTRAHEAVRESDLVVWVVDVTGPRPAAAGDIAGLLGIPRDTVLVAFNKIDLTEVPADELPEAVRMSARTGGGVPALAGAIAARLVPEPPSPGEPVPFTPAECDRWS